VRSVPRRGSFSRSASCTSTLTRAVSIPRARIAATHRGSACAASSARRIVSRRIGGSLSTTVQESTRLAPRSTTATNPSWRDQSKPRTRARRAAAPLSCDCTAMVP
jgi:hypothetical protein